MNSKGDAPSYCLKRYLEEQTFTNTLVHNAAMGTTAQSISGKHQAQFKRKTKIVDGVVEVYNLGKK